MATLESDPLTMEWVDEISIWFGPDAGLANVPILHKGEWYNGFDALHSICPSSAPGSGRPQNLDDLKKYYESWGPTMQQLLSHVTEAHVWRINETMPRKWVSNSGRVVLVGDACHAVLPNVGQGGGLAVEDAATLAECLSRASSTDDIPRLLPIYQDIRQARCQMVQRKGRALCQMMMLHDGSAQRERDETVRQFHSPQYDEEWDGVHIDDLPSDLKAPNYMAWMNGHDARLFVSVLDGIEQPLTHFPRRIANWTSAWLVRLHRASTVLPVVTNPTEYWLDQ
jgi:salicylate hydroxylase